MAERSAPLVLVAEPDSAEQPFGSYSAVLATGRHLLAAELTRRLAAAGAGVALVPRHPGPDFHWGTWFTAAARDVLAEHPSIDAVGWAAAGGLALLPDHALDALLAPAKGAVVANNRFSSDAFVVRGDVPAALAALEPLAVDNGAPRALEAAGLVVHDLADTPFSRFDVDTPQDLALLRLASRLPGTRRLDPAVTAFLEGAQLPTGTGLDIPRLDDMLAVLRNREAELFVAGRVAASTFAYLEREAACRVRLLVEERGMRAAGDHAPKSLLAARLAGAGPEALVAELATLGDAVVLDSRVLMAARAGSAQPDGWAPAGDRFASDFGDPGHIGPGWLREFTAATAASPAPFLMGGHCLVSDGLRILTDLAWQGAPSRG